MTYFQLFPVFLESRDPPSACFPIVVPATFAGNILDTIRSLLGSTYWSSSHTCVSQVVSRFQNILNIISVRYSLNFKKKNSCIRHRRKTEWLNLVLQANNSARLLHSLRNKPNVIGIKLQGEFQSHSLVRLDLLLLAYGSTSVVKILLNSSFHT